MQTSEDKIYIFQPTKEDDTYFYFTKEKTDWQVEKALCRSCLYDASLHLFQTVTPNAQIIFPYTFFANKAVVLSEADFQARFPFGWHYLEHHRPKLAKRSINGSKEPKWYQYGRSQSLTKFHQAPKLIWSVLSLRAGYAYDERNTLFTGGGNGPYYAILQTSDYSLYYILAILSHPLWEAMIKSSTSSFGGGYYSHGRQFIKNLPIRSIDFAVTVERAVHDTIVATTRQVIDAQRTLDRAKTAPQRDVISRKLTVLRNRLIGQVNDLYSITKEEVQIVANDELLHIRETDN